MFSTKRCEIRRISKSDIDSFMIYRNDEEWMKFQNFKCLTKKEYTKILINHNSFIDGLQLAIIDKNANQIIGDLYLLQESEIFWLGYTIAKSHARQGYAEETILGLIDWLKVKNMCQRICAGASPENIASVNLLTKLHFKFSYFDSLYMENIYIMDLV